MPLMLLSNRLVLRSHCLWSQVYSKNSRFLSFAFAVNKIQESVLKKRNAFEPLVGIQNKQIHLKSFDLKKENKKNSSKGKETGNTDDEDDEEDDGDDEIKESERIAAIIKEIDTTDFPKGYKIFAKSVSSLRMDAIFAAGITVSRNKIDDQFYGSKLRINNQKVLKKASKAKEGDVLDLLTDRAEDGTVLIKRVILHKILDEKTKSDRQKVILIAWKSGIKTKEEKKEF